MIIISLAIITGLLWVGYHITGALLAALLWLCIKLPCALIVACVGLVLCAMILTIPLGLKCFSCAWSLIT